MVELSILCFSHSSHRSSYAHALRTNPKATEAMLARFNLLNPINYLMHQQVEHSEVLYSADTVCVCIVFILEQTVTFALYNIN